MIVAFIRNMPVDLSKPTGPRECYTVTIELKRNLAIGCDEEPPIAVYISIYRCQGQPLKVPILYWRARCYTNSCCTTYSTSGSSPMVLSVNNVHSKLLT
jgi:hypothetical protein